jgi:hypothetical protein
MELGRRDSNPRPPLYELLGVSLQSAWLSQTRREQRLRVARVCQSAWRRRRLEAREALGGYVDARDSPRCYARCGDAPSGRQITDPVGTSSPCGCRELGAAPCGSRLARSLDRFRPLLDSSAPGRSDRPTSPIGRPERGRDPRAAPRTDGAPSTALQSGRPDRTQRPRSAASSRSLGAPVRSAVEDLPLARRARGQPLDVPARDRPADRRRVPSSETSVCGWRVRIPPGVTGGSTASSHASRSRSRPAAFGRSSRRPASTRRRAARQRPGASASLIGCPETSGSGVGRGADNPLVSSCLRKRLDASSPWFAVLSTTLTAPGRCSSAKQTSGATRHGEDPLCAVRRPRRRVSDLLRPR